MSTMHQSVLLQESIAALAINQNGIYIDGTFGRGGHASGILCSLGPGGTVLAFDKDPEAIAVAGERFGDDARFSIVHDSFAMMADEVAKRHWRGQVDGVLLDLGVSSPQLDDDARGFSFMREGPLDMRMNPAVGVSASEWLMAVDESELVQVLFDYGEERYARRIAKAICQACRYGPIQTTKQLAELVAKAHPRWEKNKHPATRTFQAIRIKINNELGDLHAVLKASLTVLKPGGRLVVISFHSLEDRIVKKFMRKEARGDDFPPGVPVTTDMLNPHLKIVTKAIKPSKLEVETNVRARSAVLRVAECLG
ncbi:ribosomal RNA small subunit methyltransferase H [Piscirickettsia salmonis]|uniref:Ribosomal RNA small subunit methyltransferase H n=2 Tax=Piscirickettsia salmonis TaxID=1238 RepID=A0A9Q6LI19_PISSA|nr:16S rRNA (cytosine(1402)-N(4))-methyltransferase RsmH [Piscirickettsia salmonis]ALA26519.1 16S rRNA methyltransferase [Piscirickettsia salmonis]APS43928.1 ribosomal RNA small subunit methyltransferase H [Piscirickettsia salmonis]APS47283.1 ribosomal RNA small subunit methyltransferase H [Piscirickettsia salmonis]APS51280.1 ribosomal RNA small subunit methyltransferase H [Piscirickettsia salmonis]APS54488.1 ribosomal RNA small subunit methyltransferase H [Piscirickettsia salmonis]